jgi:tetratricopeptide (TPR) repeat protein
MDAARLADDDLDEQTANFVTVASDLPESAAQSFIGRHRLRRTTDPRAGLFLRKLANVQAARILVSTRLYPADLQMDTGIAIAGSYGLPLTGLSDDDALNLWRAYGVSGSREKLLPVFQSFENHPLLIRALAGEVAKYRRAPGDFDEWRKANPHFDPFKLELKEVRTHVLQFALSGLDDKARHVLHIIAAFRMPATYDTLVALLIGEGKSFEGENALDTALTELEDRGLVGWDKRANRYDLHPIVRGVTWSTLDEETRHSVYERLQSYFEVVPTIADWQHVNGLEDLAPAIELYNALVGLGRYDDAHSVFRDHVSKVTLYRLSAARQRTELLEMLFADGLDYPPRLSTTAAQAYNLNALAQAYQLSGQPGRAAPLYRRSNDIQEKEGYQKNLSRGLGNLSETLRLSGALQKSEVAAYQALLLAPEQDDRYEEGTSVYLVGLVLAARGVRGKSETALRRSLQIWVAQQAVQWEGVINAYLGQRALWMSDPDAAHPFADRAWELAQVECYERDFIRAARMQGTTALGLGDWSTADERLYHALTRARAVDFAEEELPALVALAALRRQQGKVDEARERLDEVWEAAERGPYPLIHVDALNVLAYIEWDAGNHEAAVKAATEAYTKAWCDGISADGKQCFAYWWGLQAARAHLKALGAPEPVLPPFDESKFDPMPEVEINPDDEFHVG